MYETGAGPNANLIGASPAEFAAGVVTPALCIELATFNANLAAMQDAAARSGKTLRPHMKAHKSQRIARLQRETGAIGISCATGKEVETAAAAGIESILFTTPATSPAVLRRLAELPRNGHDIILALDSVQAAAIAAQASREMGAPPFRALIDINVGQNRTGVATSEAALALAAAITAERITLCGVQAYYGHLQHVRALEERGMRIGEQLDRISSFVSALRAAGYAMEIVSGGGTGTAELDLASDVFTEIQPGSYLFLDGQYSEVERPGIRLGQSLTVLARVTSAAVPNQVIIDCGTKALSTDAARFQLASPDLPGVTHRFMGDEHSALSVAAGGTLPAIGDLVSLVATHCDPTVNLHDRFHVMDGGRLVDIWPIEARGY